MTACVDSGNLFPEFTFRRRDFAKTGITSRLEHRRAATLGAMDTRVSSLIGIGLMWLIVFGCGDGSSGLGANTGAGSVRMPSSVAFQSKQ